MRATSLRVRLNARLNARLMRLARLTRRNESAIAADAIRQYLVANEWQILEIRNAIGEADKKEFASKREIRRVFGKWMKKWN